MVPGGHAGGSSGEARTSGKAGRKRVVPGRRLKAAVAKLDAIAGLPRAARRPGCVPLDHFFFFFFLSAAAVTARRPTQRSARPAAAAARGEWSVELGHKRTWSERRRRGAAPRSCEKAVLDPPAGRTVPRPGRAGSLCPSAEDAQKGVWSLAGLAERGPPPPRSCWRCRGRAGLAALFGRLAGVQRIRSRSGGARPPAAMLGPAKGRRPIVGEGEIGLDTGIGGAAI